MRPSDPPDVWIKPLRTRAERLRLLCFPYAGGAPQVFQTWTQWLPAGIGLHAVHLPGRGTRMRDPRSTASPPSWEPSSRHCAACRTCRWSSSVTAWGRCWPSRPPARCGRRNDFRPCLWNASGCRSPELIGQREKIHGLPDAAFLRKLSQLGGKPAEFLKNHELMEVLMPMRIPALGAPGLPDHRMRRHTGSLRLR